MGGSTGEGPGCCMIEGNQRIPMVAMPGAPLINQGQVLVKDHPWEHSPGTPEPPEG